jgi:hypothetical protein
MGHQADDFLRCLVDLVGPIAGQQVFFDGVCEAILNACNHAYDPRFKLPGQLPWIGRRWWAAGGYDRRRKEITLVVYDQGAGIPGTLPGSKIWSSFRRTIMGEPSDAETIAAALEYRISRTGMAGRGEGLAQLAYLVDHSEAGYLRILSGAGEIVYNGHETTRASHELPLGGTLIVWEIDHPDAAGTN